MQAASEKDDVQAFEDEVGGASEVRELDKSFMFLEMEGQEEAAGANLPRRRALNCQNCMKSSWFERPFGICRSISFPRRRMQGPMSS